MTPLLLILLQAGTPAAPPSTQSGKEVVVTARPLDDTARALADCLARKCPPREDIAATLAHAENQFVAGDYPAARRTLLAARGRNARYAKELPVEVAGLSRANARLAALNGFRSEARLGEIESLEALKAGLPADDPRVLRQRLELGDHYARQGEIVTAIGHYDDVARQARRANLPAVEAQAMFRITFLYGAVATVSPEYREAARRAAARLMARDEPAFQPYRNGVLLLRARLAEDGDRAAAIDRALAQFRGHPVARPVLVHAPPIDLQQAGQVNATTVQARGEAAAQWADISFWIAPDGTVRDIDVLRESRNRGGPWLGLVTRSVAARRYAPLALDPASPGLLRVERYSLVYDREFATGSRIATRSPVGRIETLDLTADAPAG